MKFEGTDISEDHSVGFVKIVDVEGAQQTKINAKLLMRVVKFLDSLSNMGFEEIYITVQKDTPVIIGGKTIGIAIIPIID